MGDCAAADVAFTAADVIDGTSTVAASPGAADDAAGDVTVMAAAGGDSAAAEVPLQEAAVRANSPVPCSEAAPAAAGTTAALTAFADRALAVS